MAEKGGTAILAAYFNKNSKGELINPLREFASQVRQLSDEERTELVTGVCAVTGDVWSGK